MNTGQKPDTTLLSGRDFTDKELEEVRETIRMFPKLSLYELVNTLCENLGWVTPSGRYKFEACMQMLEKLEARGQVELPAKKRGKRGKERVVWTSRTDAPAPITGELAGVSPVRLEPVTGRDRIRLWNEYIARYHVLSYKRPFGSHQRYFIVDGRAGRYLGCLLFAASAWALAARDEWIGWTEEDRKRRLHLIVNNTRFLIFPWVQVKNLASKVLSLAAKQIGKDWQRRYCYRPALLETFVDEARYRGTSYQAANWLYLGRTAGRGRMDRYTQYLSSPKLIYVYPLTADFRERLLGEVGER